MNNLKYIKNYSTFLITESIQNTNGIKNYLVPKTQKHINKNLSQLLRLNKNSIAFIGGAGKGISEDIINDINVCIDKKELLEQNNLTEDEVYDFIQTQLKRLGIKSEIKKDEDRIIAAWPIQGIIKQGIVETSIQLTEHINWVKFSRYSPNLNENESKFKGKYREALIKSIVESMKQEITAYFDDKDTVKEFKEYFYDVHKGLFSITKTFEGKHGILSKAQPIENSKKIVTNDPNEFVKIVFNEKAKPENYLTFEQCWNEFQKNKTFNKKRNKIIERFKRILINMKLSLPEGLL